MLDIPFPGDAGPQPSVFSVAERPDLRALIEAVDREAFPPYMLHADVQDYMPAVYRHFPEWQLVLLDGPSGQHLAHGNMVPFPWDGTTEDLPSSAAEMIVRALLALRGNVPATAAGALQAVVHPALQGRGLSPRMLAAMAGLAAERGLADLFAPIRPNRKSRYPLTPFGSYVRWTRADGLPVDDWQRQHVRLGATPAGVVPAWLTVTGSLREWSDWTGMVFPESGGYVVPGALVPVEVNAELGVGRYAEPHLWMRYHLIPASAGAAAPGLTTAA
jgi:hypothetical protein